MKLEEKKQILAAIKTDFERGMYYKGKVENVGSVFFLYNTGACVLRDTVYYRSKHYGLDFEALSMTSSYFVGSKAHAEALQQAFGGHVNATEFCAFAEEARELYEWEGPKRRQQLEQSAHFLNVEPLDIEEIKMALF